jgi:hypothetical protein
MEERCSGTAPHTPDGDDLGEATYAVKIKPVDGSTAAVLTERG